MSKSVSWVVLYVRRKPTGGVEGSGAVGAGGFVVGRRVSVKVVGKEMGAVVVVEELRCMDVVEEGAGCFLSWWCCLGVVLVLLLVVLREWVVVARAPSMSSVLTEECHGLRCCVSWVFSVLVFSVLVLPVRWRNGDVVAWDKDNESISKEVLMTSFTDFLLSRINCCNVPVFKDGATVCSEVELPPG